ncbi:MAG TPA: hypothetical protein PKA33_20750 [Amaricoccus sp.]|uniref:hypothetical protein n=1 Tax=Amaricoccus sp. TaxID=1872485 RepID=UPI002CC846FA|nr:hypothetical protein [Amaricoccus sp.]HMQ94626.1 hypothetical protein [Amaricoccus sp.]HMR54747.1 hypothetical protein [Amaricoccus sp.]HMR61690.1 hypothetical protein [Amaricoccus sp.]HMU01759.1 hypothetical protein [Amaricoccus sp.]
MSAPDSTIGDDVLALTQDLVERVIRDDRGRLVGGVWVDGNGGLLSEGTIHTAEQLRRAIGNQDAAREGRWCPDRRWNALQAARGVLADLAHHTDADIRAAAYIVIVYSDDEREVEEASELRSLVDPGDAPR